MLAPVRNRVEDLPTDVPIGTLGWVQSENQIYVFVGAGWVVAFPSSHAPSETRLDASVMPSRRFFFDEE